MVVVGNRHPKYRRIERPPPETGSLEQIQDRFRTASQQNDRLLCERCLLGIAEVSGIQAVDTTILDRLWNPRFLEVPSGPWWGGVRHLSIGCQISPWRQCSDVDFTEVACPLDAKQCARTMDTPDEQTSRAIELLDQALAQIEQRPRATGGDKHFTESEFREKMESGDVATAFGAVTAAWLSGLSIQRFYLR